MLRLAGKGLAPLAIVQTREKAIASFAEKALRKMHKYSDPVNQLTDLCGARVITRTRSEVDAYCEFIKSHFEIDWDNSLDTSQRLKPSEFGYRSIHYIIKFRRNVDYGIEIPEEVFCLKAEVQVRTLVEHAYADFGHDLTYKGAFALPIAWQRELASVAAALEEVDQTFSRIEDRLRDYTTSYGKYLSEEERLREIDRLEIILEHVPDDAGLAAQLGKLAIIQEDWDKAEKTLARFVDPTEPERAPQPILRDLGVTYCKKYDSGTPMYTQGQRYLEIASAPERGDVDAMCSLAGTWKEIDEEKAREYYRRAFQADPHDAYALSAGDGSAADSEGRRTLRGPHRCRHQPALGSLQPRQAAAAPRRALSKPGRIRESDSAEPGRVDDHDIVALAGPARRCQPRTGRLRVDSPAAQPRTGCPLRLDGCDE